MLSYLHRTQILILDEFMDELLGVNDPPGSGGNVLCKSTDVHHWGNKVSRFPQTYIGGYK